MFTIPPPALPGSGSKGPRNRASQANGHPLVTKRIVDATFGCVNPPEPASAGDSRASVWSNYTHRNPVVADARTVGLVAFGVPAGP